MTEIDSQMPRVTRTTGARFDTVYRDAPLPAFGGGQPVVRARRLPFATLSLPTEHVSDGILVGLTALTVPALVYCFVQLWSLLAGGSLNQAVRAFLP